MPGAGCLSRITSPPYSVIDQIDHQIVSPADRDHGGMAVANGAGRVSMLVWHRRHLSKVLHHLPLD